ncbi:hypothetical protein CTAYLR_010176 [Chrysophaeum taylorii]|uniref:Tyrosinase copper-binding domain-containing protein n=1 Tax=Chrysophaeum taylorii TaxID=2483200 RepID=A0AAD7UMU5_9STRA|nr:hypothetical protein CTAYLR_010176 [Chrysophaeum taylorii]
MDEERAVLLEKKKEEKKRGVLEISSPKAVTVRKKVRVERVVGVVVVCAYVAVECLFLLPDRRRVRVVNTQYGSPPSTLEAYGLEHVAEPFATSKIIGGGRWRATRDSANATVSGRKFECRRPRGHTMLASGARVIRVSCLFVRREVRALSARDRATWVEKMRSAPLGELAELHATTVDGCSPFHGGVAFFTAHAAFTRRLDLVLGVPTPYWDFTIDAEYEDWKNSEIFGLDLFGPCDAEEGLGGAFEGTLRRANCDGPATNAACFVSDPRDADADPLVKRSCANLCGSRIYQLPRCADARQCDNETTLAGLHACAEFVLHGNLHAAIGGMWDCGFDLGDEWPALVSMAPRLLPLWQRTLRTPCPRLPPKQLLLEQGVIEIENFDIVKSDFLDASYFHVVDDDLKLKDAEDDPRFWDLLARAACAGEAKMGAMTTNAAPNDPVFWPLHPYFDRLLARTRLAGTLLDESWPDDLPCRSVDALTPFTPSDLSFPDDDDDDDHHPSYYTNRDLYRLFDPRNTDYIYDSFDAPHCAATNDAPAYTLRDTPSFRLDPTHARS